jgi:hypothetical protein
LNPALNPKKNDFDGALRLVVQWTKMSRRKKQWTATLGSGRRLWAVDGDVGLDGDFGLDSDFWVVGNGLADDAGQ